MDMEKVGTRIDSTYEFMESMIKIGLYGAISTIIAYYTMRNFVVQDMQILVLFCFFFLLASALGAGLAITGTRKHIRGATQVVLVVFSAGIVYQASLWYLNRSIVDLSDSMIPFSLTAVGFLLPVLAKRFAKF